MVVAVETIVRDPAARDLVARAVKRRVFDIMGLAVADVVALARGELPKTSSGKLQRYRARELYERGELGRPPEAGIASRIASMRRLAHGRPGSSPRDEGRTTGSDRDPSDPRSR